MTVGNDKVTAEAVFVKTNPGDRDVNNEVKKYFRTVDMLLTAGGTVECQ